MDKTRNSRVKNPEFDSLVKRFMESIPNFQSPSSQKSNASTKYRFMDSRLEKKSAEGSVRKDIQMKPKIWLTLIIHKSVRMYSIEKENG